MNSVTLFITLFYTFATLGLLTKLILNLLNIRHIAKNRKTLPTEFSQSISLEDHQKAADYSCAKLKFTNITTLISFLLLLFWLPFGGLKWIDSYAREFQYSMIFTGLLFFALFSLINFIIDLPEAIYRTFVLEEKFGFNKTTPKVFIIDLIKQTILGIILGAPLLYTLLWMMQQLGDNWWIYAWIFIVIFQFFIIWAYPKFIAPLFNKFTKLQNEELKNDIDLLIKNCNLHFKDYYIMNASLRSSHGNAYFTGFGKNKRIVFYDTLIQSLKNQEIIAVLAHELGHLKHKHILKSLLWNILFMGIGLFILGQLYQSPHYLEQLSGAKNSSYLALILFSYITSIFTFAFTPLSSWLSRKKEYEADSFASQYADGQALIDALVKMYKDNSSTLTPSPTYSKFYYSHPPALERVHFIKSQIKKS